MEMHGGGMDYYMHTRKLVLAYNGIWSVSALSMLFYRLAFGLDVVVAFVVVIVVVFIVVPVLIVVVVVVYVDVVVVVIGAAAVIASQIWLNAQTQSTVRELR